MGKIIIYVGCFLIFLGFLIHYFGDHLKWFGNLPGDVKIANKNINIFIPFTSMILLSILLTVIINFLKKVLK